MHAIHSPALLTCTPEDLAGPTHDFLKRIAALVLHREMVRGYRATLVTSAQLVERILVLFPWAQAGLEGVRDLRQVVMDDLQRAEYIALAADGDYSLQPPTSLGPDVDAEVAALWARTAWSGASGLDEMLHVLSWMNPYTSPAITIDQADENLGSHALRVLASRADWAEAIDPCAAWPNLRLAVDTYYLRADGLGAYPLPGSHWPMPYEWTDEFIDSVDSLAVPAGLLREVVKSITKRVYGSMDRGLGDEVIAGIGRFRVTRFWRIHYSPGPTIVLRRFGPHDMDGIN